MVIFWPWNVIASGIVLLGGKMTDRGGRLGNRPEGWCWETSTLPERVLILRTWSLIRTFLAFWVLIGSLFIFQGPYFHYFGFIHAKNVNSVCIGSGLHCWQILIFTYAYALIFIHRRFGSLFWLLGVLIGSLFHKKNGSLLGPYLKAWGSLLVLETVQILGKPRF